MTDAMRHWTILLFAVLLAALPARAQRLAWGDQGNGTYINPVLNADYSDPDVIRVGEKYYMVASDFHFLGMQILESDDMVNWRIVTQLYDRFDFPEWERNGRYAGGSWAPAIRWHAGRLWVYFCTPDEGLFMTSAPRAEGPWEPLHQVKAIAGWEDPCPFWDEDGKAYLGRSRKGAGPIVIHRMSEDGRTLLDDGLTVYTGPVAEGTKIHKLDGWYYLSIPEGGVSGGWQTILRSRNIYGPYEKKVVLETGSTAVNGPHQGALVDTPDGQWWFYHFQRSGALGRVVHLQPVHWQDGWPVIGVDIDRNGIGEPVYVWQSPLPGRGPSVPQTSDDFSAGQLQPQWQWNHNPVPEAWSLTEQPGALTLHALPSDSFRTARNTLTQRVLGYESEVTVELDFSRMAEGGRFGLAAVGKPDEMLGILRRDGRFYLYRGADAAGETELQAARGKKVWLRLRFDLPAQSYRFYFSPDGKTFTEAGAPFFTDYANWKGVRWGVYHYNTKGDGGSAAVQSADYRILR